MDFLARIKSHFDENAKALNDSLVALQHPLNDGILAMSSCLANGNKVLACGNGGSAADAQHFIAELVGRFERERNALPGIALNTDTSILTAVGNDYGYDEVFKRQVLALGNRGDILVAISTSGNSKNVIAAIHSAHEKGVRVISVVGRDGGAMRNILKDDDIELCVPSKRTMRIQEIHILLLHILCDGVDAIIFKDTI